jgi:Tol biopolymer transport system component
MSFLDFIVIIAALAVPASCISLGDGNPLPVTGLYGHPSWSPNGNGLAFAGEGYRGLYFMDTGGNLKQISNSPLSGWGFSWSPNGQNLAYRMKNEKGEALMLAGTDGNGKQITPYQDKIAQPQWTKDGLTYKAGDEMITVDEKGNVKKVYSLSKGVGLLARIMNVSAFLLSSGITGASLTPLTAEKAAGAEAGDKDSEVAFIDQDSQIWVVDENGNRKKLIDVEGVQGYASPVASPDGDKYAVRGFDDNLYVASPNGGLPVNLGAGTDPTWSPGGDYVIYVRQSDDGHRITSSDLWISSADGSRQMKLTSTDGIEESPSWSPDGKYVAYVVDGVVQIAPIQMD